MVHVGLFLCYGHGGAITISDPEQFRGAFAPRTTVGLARSLSKRAFVCVFGEIAPKLATIRGAAAQRIVAQLKG